MRQIPPSRPRRSPDTTAAFFGTSRSKTFLSVVSVLVVLAALAAFGAYSSNSLIQASERNRRNDRLAMAGSLADHVESNIATATTFLASRMAMAQPSMVPGDPRDKAKLDMVAKLGAGLALQSVDGTVLTTMPGKGKVPHAGDPVYRAVARRLAGGRTNVSPVTKVDGQPRVGVSTYVRHGDKPVGIATWFLDLSHIEGAFYVTAPIVKSERPGYTGALLINREGQIVGGGNVADVGRKVSMRHPWSNVVSSNAGHVEYDDKGVRRVVVFAPVGKSELVLALVEDASDFYGSLRRDHQRTTLALLGVLIAAAATLVVVNHRRQRSVAASERRLTALLGNAADAILVVRSGVVAFASPGTRPLFGRSPEEVAGTDLTSLFEEAGAEHPLTQLCAQAAAEPGRTLTAEASYTVDGTTRWASVHALDLRNDPAVRGSILTCHDVTELKELHEEMAYQALHDPLTGLPNRALFADNLDRAVKRRSRSGQDVVVIFLDLDHFKPINDRYGHKTGDAVLRAVASRLQACVRDFDTVARLGGDEFAIVLEGDADVPALTRRVIDAIGQPIDADGHEVAVGVSLGVAVAGEHTRADDVLRDADLAMYTAKESGGDRYHIHGAEMRGERADA